MKTAPTAPPPGAAVIDTGPAPSGADPGVFAALLTQISARTAPAEGSQKDSPEMAAGQDAPTLGAGSEQEPVAEQGSLVGSQIVPAVAVVSTPTLDAAAPQPVIDESQQSALLEVPQAAMAAVQQSPNPRAQAVAVAAAFGAELPVTPAPAPTGTVPTAPGVGVAEQPVGTSTAALVPSAGIADGASTPAAAAKSQAPPQAPVEASDAVAIAAAPAKEAPTGKSDQAVSSSAPAIQPQAGQPSGAGTRQGETSQGRGQHEQLPHQAANLDAPSSSSTPEVPQTPSPPQVQPAAAPAAQPAAASAAPVAPTVSPAVQAVPVAAAPVVLTHVALTHQGTTATVEHIQDLVRIAGLRDGNARATLQLKPAELGSVNVHLRTTADGLVASIHAHDLKALAALRQAGGELQQSLQDRGINLARIELQLSSGDGSAARDRHHSAQAFADGRGSGGGRGHREHPTDDAVELALTPVAAVTPTTHVLADGSLVDVQA